MVCLFVRETKPLLRWRFMTTGQTPGALSTLMHHGRPGKRLFCICIAKEAKTLFFCGRFHWLKGSNQQSNSTVEWYIPPTAASGFYRIKHFGHYKQLKGLQPVITPYEGTSDVFRVARSFYSWLNYGAELKMLKYQRKCVMKIICACPSLLLLYIQKDRPVIKKS